MEESISFVQKNTAVPKHFHKEISYQRLTEKKQVHIYSLLTERCLLFVFW